MSETRSPLKLARKTTSVLIVESLRERFMNGEFKESETIRQEHLAKEYNVSLSPVREALIQLEAEGLLTLVRHRGYTVTAMSADDIRQLYELRAMVEPKLIEYAIPKFQESDLAAAKKLYETMDKIYKRGTQTSAWTDVNWEFHMCLYKPAHKSHLLAVVENAYANINLYIHRKLKVRNSVDLARNMKEHAKLLDYCENRVADQAAELLRSHILQAGEDAIGFLQKHKPPTT